MKMTADYPRSLYEGLQIFFFDMFKDKKKFQRYTECSKNADYFDGMLTLSCSDASTLNNVNYQKSTILTGMILIMNFCGESSETDFRIILKLAIIFNFWYI